MLSSAWFIDCSYMQIAYNIPIILVTFSDAFGATTVDQETCTTTVHTHYIAESHIRFSNHSSDIFVSVIVLNQTLIK